MTHALDQLRQVRDRLRSILDGNETFVSWLAITDAISLAEAKLAAATELHRSTSGPPSMPATVADKAVEIIAKQGQPLSTQQLYEELTANGVTIGGATPMKNLRTTLSKCARLKSVQIGPSSRDDRGWWFADRPLPNGYEKGLTTEMARPLQSNGAADWYSA